MEGPLLSRRPDYDEYWTRLEEANDKIMTHSGETSKPDIPSARKEDNPG